MRLAYSSPRLLLDLDFTFEGEIKEAESHAEEVGNQIERLLAPENIKVHVSGSKLAVSGSFYRYFLVYGAQRPMGRRAR